MDVTFAWWFQMVSICWWVIGAQRSFRLFQSGSINRDGFRGHPNELVVLEIYQAIKPYLMLLWLPPSQWTSAVAWRPWTSRIVDCVLLQTRRLGALKESWIFREAYLLYKNMGQTWELLLWDTQHAPLKQAVVELCWKDSNGELLNRRLFTSSLEAWE